MHIRKHKSVQMVSISINRRTIIAILSILVCMAFPVQAQDKDSTGILLLNKVRKAFNGNDEQEFYRVAGDYRSFLLSKKDISAYYLSWKNEILYDVNHNHFYRALRKTMSMQNDMKMRKAEKEYYKVTHLRGIIYSLRGNLPLAHQYFEKALDQVDHSQPANLVSLYMDLANIEMDTQPEEAMKHLDCAIEIIKANGASYEYSDAIGFKVIVAYAMRDWKTVNKTFAEYISLEKALGNDFSTTYYNYAVICKAVADKRYHDAIQQTYLLTNSTDIYKFQTEIYELAGDTRRAFETQKHYLAIKDSVNNVIMSEEMVGTANDLENAEQAKEEFSRRNEHLTWSLFGVAIAVALIGFLACRCRKRKYMKQLKQQNHELTIARDKAREAERMKISFLQNMSHEIRTPLNVICGYAQIISDPKTLISEQERADMATRIRNSTRSIVSIIDEILDIAGKESIHFIDKADKVNCNELAKNILISYVDRDEHIKIHFESTLKDSFKMITNRREVEKILNHLLDNAFKFTREGDVTLRCYLNELEQMVCFSVTDTGCGVKEGEEEKIFENFYKVDVYKEGVGLGLPLSRRVARQLGGSVELDSTHKPGSCFVLKLPLE